MTENDLLKRIAIAKAKPDNLTDLRPSELAELVLVVLEYVKKINFAISEGQIKGEKGDDAITPVPDKDYLSLPTAKREIEAILSKAVDSIDRDVKNRLSKVKDGKDAQITREQIEEAAKIASTLIQIPDFPTLITQEPEAIRDSLELLKGDERLSIKAIDGIEEVISELEKKITSKGGGGAGARAVKWLNDITNADSAAANTVLKKNANGTFSFLAESGGAGSSDWGDIGGTLSDQTDLQTALDAKVAKNANITAATKTKITYDVKGLVTAGADATTADIADSADKRYVTDAQRTVIQNTSGTNTGDQDLSGYFNKSADDTDDITAGSVNKFATAAEKTKLGHITVTQAVDLDQIESDTVTNNAKVTNATHTGEVTGATALTVDKTAITGKSAVTPVGTDYILISDTSDGANLKKALISDLPGGGGGISNVVEDLSPQLGGNLDLNTFTVGDADAADLTKLSEVTSSSAELNILDGVTATASELNALDGITSTVTELNYTDGVTSAIQTQLDGKQPLDSDLTTIAGLTATTDNFMQAKAGAWASRTIAQVKSDLGLTGTNSGDQTSIVGITGTTAQFNTALTDNDFATLAGTETLTNKTINASNNTITNIGASEIESGIINDLSAETTIADSDLVMIYDASATALRKMTKANFVTGLGSGSTTKPFINIPITLFHTGSATPTYSYVQNRRYITWSGDLYVNVILPVAYAGGGLTLDFWYYNVSDGDTNHNIQCTAAIDRFQASTTNVTSTSFAAAQSMTARAVTNTFTILKDSISFTNGAQMDSVAAGESFSLKMTKGGSVSGNLGLLDVAIRET